MNLLRKKDQNCYVHLMGGLGNQLFQIAAGLHYVYHSGGNLIIDDSFGNFRKNNLGDAAVFSYDSHSFSATGSGFRKKRLTEKGLSLLIRISLKSRSNTSYETMENSGKFMPISKSFLMAHLHKPGLNAIDFQIGIELKLID